MKQNQVQQKEIRLGTHGEHYGSWMSNPVFYVIGALLALSVVLAVYDKIGDLKWRHFKSPVRYL